MKHKVDPTLKHNWKMYGTIIAVLVVLFYVYFFSTRFSNRIITVKKDDIIKASGKYSQNLVGATNGSLYSVKSNPLILFFKSAEIMNQLEEGKTYMISGYGIRIPMINTYPQITSAELVQ